MFAVENIIVLFFLKKFSKICRAETIAVVAGRFVFRARNCLSRITCHRKHKQELCSDLQGFKKVLVRHLCNTPFTKKKQYVKKLHLNL